MNLEPREEWISAYLDDELSPAERAEVERMMAEQPALRQLHDELATLRATMQSLPRQQLKHDLAPAVLRRAERAVLRGNAAADADDARSTVSVGQWWSQGAGWRRLAWPAIAVAAALVIALFDAEEQAPQRQVAQAPRGETTISARPAPAADSVVVQTPAAEATAGSRYAAPHASRVEKQVDRREPNSPNREAPMLAAPASAPTESSTAAAKVGLPAKSMATLAARSAIVCNVSPEYLRDKQFEKVLAQLNVQWKADERTDPSPVAAEGLPAKPSGEGTAAQTYVVEATSEQLDALLAALRKNSSDVKQVLDRRAASDQDGAPPTDEKQSYRILIQSLPVSDATPAATDKN